jgi:hypothetical protein
MITILCDCVPLSTVSSYAVRVNGLRPIATTHHDQYSCYTNNCYIRLLLLLLLVTSTAAVDGALISSDYLIQHSYKKLYRSSNSRDSSLRLW